MMFPEWHKKEARIDDLVAYAVIFHLKFNAEIMIENEIQLL